MYKLKIVIRKQYWRPRWASQSTSSSSLEAHRLLPPRLDRQMPEVGHGPGPPPPRARESDRTARWLSFTRHFTFSGPLLSESENAAIWTALLSAARPSFVSIPAVYNGFFTPPWGSGEKRSKKNTLFSKRIQLETMKTKGYTVKIING